jgi:hypothetical protein
MNDRRVEVLVFEGCPNAEVTLERARAAALAAGVGADVQVVLVQTDEEARRLRFLGSPSVRVDGVDVDPDVASRDDFGLQCRVYAVGARMQGAPPMEWITDALRRARTVERSPCR